MEVFLIGLGCLAAALVLTIVVCRGIVPFVMALVGEGKEPKGPLMNRIVRMLCRTPGVLKVFFFSLRLPWGRRS